MKLSSKVIVALPLLAVGLACATYAVLPTQMDVEERLVLEASPEEVYALLENPTQWERWSPVNKQADPSMIRLYGGPMAGAGARMQWSGDRVGNGELLITESLRPAQLAYLQHEHKNAGSIQGAITLAPVPGGTQVVWRQQAVVGQYPWGRVQGLLLQRRKQEEAQKGLQNLQTLLVDSSKKKAAKKRTTYADRH
ncbi:SRPBCC family protein [Pontibacter sp. E15-1]|uniref:SRPBCC family protein n=1 Tax=Pontibacter sp. E15-1 TaxID=2919918 RepID=UPI001F4FA9D2|nr:SRPBCC family protein [Pontibacter sp. E15-1]MCJ8166299.1 SRPBCC family protein [Pontibacter sp. E15-1]